MPQGGRRCSAVHWHNVHADFSDSTALITALLSLGALTFVFLSTIFALFVDHKGPPRGRHAALQHLDFAVDLAPDHPAWLSGTPNALAISPFSSARSVKLRSCTSLNNCRFSHRIAADPDHLDPFVLEHLHVVAKTAGLLGAAAGQRGRDRSKRPARLSRRDRPTSRSCPGHRSASNAGAFWPTSTARAAFIPNPITQTAKAKQTVSWRPFQEGERAGSERLDCAAPRSGPSTVRV